ncbi:putative exonuclease [Erwinia phage Snitter]|nr:putative exonuclease [Erwinia phage Snitter]
MAMTKKSEFKVFTNDQLSNDEYHSKDGWASEYVSGSSLSDIYSTCPAAWRFSQKSPTAALEFGTQSHTNFECAELFQKTYRRAPHEGDYKDLITSQAALAAKLKSFGLTGTSGKAYPELIKMYANCGEDLEILWLEDMIAQSKAAHDGVELVKAENYDSCIRMRQVLEAIPKHAQCMNSPTAQREMSIFGTIAGTKVKVRLDHVDVVPDYIIWEFDEALNEMVPKVYPEVVVITDYKTTSSANPEEFNSHAARLGYYLKMALQRDLFVKAFAEERPVVVRLLAQEKKEPYIPLAFILGDEQLRMGRVQYMEVLSKFNGWVSSDSWPAYNGNEPEIFMETPIWFKKKFEGLI